MPTYLRKQKKIFCATLSDEDTDDSEEADGGTNAFIVNIIETDSAIEDESGNFEEEGEDNLSLEQLEIKQEEDSKALMLWKKMNGFYQLYLL